MKKALLLLLCAAPLALHAKPVSPSVLDAIAARFYPKGAEVTTHPFGSELMLYQWRQGYVLLATDDCVRPVLAYSTTSPFATDSLPPHIAHWIEGYRREIASCIEAAVQPSARVVAEWQYFTSPSPLSPKHSQGVAPMLTTRWDQSPLYNAQCPVAVVGEDRVPTVTGCVATATAQIMKYWNHPITGWGSYSYNDPSFGILQAQFDTTHYRWHLMPDTLSYLSPDEEVEAVAELMFHVGVAVRMSYSPTASGAYCINYGNANVPSSETALKTYFRYSPLLQGVLKAEYSDAAWHALMCHELEEGRPVLYSGYDEAGGHAFVFDGYDTLGFFHVNWGWGGRNNGYYTIDSLSPGSGGAGGNATYTFNQGNQALIGIQPVAPAEGDTGIVDMRFDPTRGTVVGNGAYLIDSAEATIIAIANPAYRFVGWASGAISNPLTFLVVGNTTDSALFLPIMGDTLGFCSDGQLQSWQDDYGFTTQWGIRLSDTLRGTSREVVAAQLYVYALGEYTLTISQGDTPDDALILYSRLHSLQDYGWQTIRLPQPVALSDSGAVWLTVSHTGYDFPATYSRYSGNRDGSWYRLPEGWITYDEQGVYASWMLRAVMQNQSPSVGISPVAAEVERPRVEGRIVVGTDASACLFDAMGRAIGSGLRIQAPAPGLYLLRTSAASFKIVIP